ncbi:MAG: salt stress protein, Slr1339 family [cyanobacterium endosymbiont of Rhopalodia musculus]
MKLLTRKAEQWLKEFNITLDEGFWFEQFSASYPSKLEAALDYITALDDTS